MDGGTVELRYLLALAAVARDHSFSQAAASLGYTQSAVSQQIAKLERIVGHRLIDRPRGTGRVSLTEAGDILLVHAEAVAARLASAKADLESLATGNAGVLRLGCFQSVGARILPRIIREFTAERPGVRIQLTEAEDDAELLHAVEYGDLDLTFIVFPIMAGPFTSVELLKDPYVVVVQPDSDFARQAGPVALQQLKGLPLITYAQMREVHAIETRIGHPELTQQIVFRSNANSTILGLAAEGLGTAVISSLSVDPSREGLVQVPLAGVAPRTIGIAWHSDRYRNPALDAFVRVAQHETQTWA